MNNKNNNDTCHIPKSELSLIEKSNIFMKKLGKNQIVINSGPQFIKKEKEPILTSLKTDKCQTSFQNLLPN